LRRVRTNTNARLNLRPAQRVWTAVERGWLARCVPLAEELGGPYQLVIMSVQESGWRAELEGWRAGGLEGWRAGGLEGWRAGGLQGCRAAGALKAPRTSSATSFSVYSKSCSRSAQLGCMALVQPLGFLVRVRVRVIV